MKHRLHEILHSNEDFKEEDFAKVCVFVYMHLLGVDLLELHQSLFAESLLSVEVLPRAFVIWFSHFPNSIHLVISKFTKPLSIQRNMGTCGHPLCKEN